MFDQTVLRCLRGCGVNLHEPRTAASVSRALRLAERRAKQASVNGLPGLAYRAGGYLIAGAINAHRGDAMLSERMLRRALRLAEASTGKRLPPGDMRTGVLLSFLGRCLLRTAKRHFSPAVRQTIKDWKGLTGNEQLLAAWNIARWLERPGVRTEAAAMVAYCNQTIASVLPAEFDLRSSRKRPNCIGRALVTAAALREAGARCWYVTPLETPTTTLRKQEGMAARLIVALSRAVVKKDGSSWYSDLQRIAARGVQLEARPAWQHGCILVELSDRRLVLVDAMGGTATLICDNPDLENAVRVTERLKFASPGLPIQVSSDAVKQCDAARWKRFQRKLECIGRIVALFRRGVCGAKFAATVAKLERQYQQRSVKTRAQVRKRSARSQRASEILYQLQGFAADVRHKAKSAKVSKKAADREAVRVFIVRALESAYDEFTQTSEHEKFVPREFEVQPLDVGLASVVCGHVAALTGASLETEDSLCSVAPGSYRLHNLMVPALRRRSSKAKEAACKAAALVSQYPWHLRATDRVLAALRARKVVPTSGVFHG